MQSLRSKWGLWPRFKNYRLGVLTKYQEKAEQYSGEQDKIELRHLVNIGGIDRSVDAMNDNWWEIILGDNQCMS